MNTRIISSMSDFIRFLEDNAGKGFLYRGQYRDWPLLPRIARFAKMTYEQRDFAEIERNMLRTFSDDSVPFREHEDLNNLELLTLAQHHGMATRLLDWTSNSLASLWFAVSQEPEYYQSEIHTPNPASYEGYEIVLRRRSLFPEDLFTELDKIRLAVGGDLFHNIMETLVLSPSSFVSHSHQSEDADSNTKVRILLPVVKILESLPKVLLEYRPLTDEEFMILIGKSSVGYSVLWLLESQVADQEIQVSDDPFGTTSTVFFKPRSFNRRIVAQSAWMALFAVNNEASSPFIPMQEDSHFSDRLVKLLIPAPKVMEFRTGLNVCGIDGKSLFLDMDGLCSTINWCAYVDFINH